VIGLDVVDLTEPELRREILNLRRRVQKLTALLHLALAILRTSEFSLAGELLPEGRAKMRILRVVDRTLDYFPFASSPTIPTCVAESVPRLAPPAARVCA
jgi:hypothetical protein